MRGWMIALSLLLVSLASRAQAQPEPDDEVGIRAPCVANATTLCLNQNRFRVTSRWRTPDGRTGSGQAVALTSDTGYFWFFRSANVEYLVKVLNACSTNSRYWVFAGGLTNLDIETTVEDTTNGARRVYRNPQRTAFVPVQDTQTFRACTRADAEAAPAETAFLPAAAAGATLAEAPALLLHQGRFKVSAIWRAPDGRSGEAQPVSLTAESGYFWFLNRANTEIFVKLLDGCAAGGHFWFFSAGLTNVAVELRVEDTITGVVKRYSSPGGPAFQPIQDSAALFTCSLAGVPPDPGPAGASTLRGVDSDRDGIRDDLQRFIRFAYGGSPNTEAALRQLAGTLQRSVLDAASSAASRDHAAQMVRDLGCLSFVRPGGSGTAGGELISKLVNTTQRLDAYLRFNEQLGGQTYALRPQSEGAASCGFLRSRGEASPRGQAQCQDDDSLASVFFLNGVMTTFEDALDNAAYMAFVLQIQLPLEVSRNIRVGLAYNRTYGFVDDLWEAVRQRLDSDSEQFYRFLAAVDPMPDFMQTAFTNIASNINHNALLSNPNALAHLVLFQGEILEGRKVIVVAHSQGNLFANRIFQNLSADEQESLGIVAVANPDSVVRNSPRVPGGATQYTTLRNDLVIAAIPGAMGSNTAGSFLLRDPLGHGFEASYLKPNSASRQNIVSFVRSTYAALRQPPETASPGVITVTLNWGAEPDVDLHVFEPDGTHVFYADRQGRVGFLDVDDVTSFGPEHYFASCDDLIPGNYRVGVNYYSGDEPETATVRVAAGPVVRVYNIPLPVALGSAGNSSPVPVATVLVSGNATEGFTFDIQ